MDRELTVPESRPLSLVSKIGLAIIGLSLVLWIVLPIVPFLPLTTRRKAAVALVIFILAEVTFYLGAFLAGKAVLLRFKAWFNPKRWWTRIEP